MSNSINRVILLGNLGKDPEIRTTQSGMEIASFSVACSEKWKDKSSGDYKEKTEWVNVSVFQENLVKVVKNYLAKGSKVYLEGKFQTNKYTDKSGQERYSTVVALQGFDCKLILLDKKEQGAGDVKNGYSQPENNDIALDDEIPF